MATTVTTQGSSSNTDVKVASEIPQDLIKALLMTVKKFYSPEQAIIIYYVIQSVCISEEKLRAKINLDQKQLRQISVPLKQDKLLRERLIQVKSAVTGKNQSVIYYFVNYRAITNVFKYKIDHMRQRIEDRARAVVHVSAYKCSGCSTSYDTIEVDRIIDPMTGELKCWRCHSEVVMQDIANKTGTQGTIAQFNLQMRPLFELLQTLEGIQLAPHLCEPDINKFLAMDREAAAVAAADELVTKTRRVELGGKAFGADIGLKYRNADAITVDMNAGENVEIEEGKAVPLWLQANPEDIRENTHVAIPHDGADVQNKRNDVASALALHELAAFEESTEQPDHKRPRLEESNLPLSSSLSMEIKSSDIISDDDESDDEDEMISVGGKMVHMSEITNEMVQSMNDEERASYVAAVQQHAHDYV